MHIYHLNPFLTRTQLVPAMLQPQNYPRMIGQALVLEPDPLIEMVDDDNPWVEGLFFTFLLGLMIGIAKLIGSILLTASLPDPTVALEAALAAWRQAAPVGAADISAVERNLRTLWPFLTGMMGYGGGWSRLIFITGSPLLLILDWLVYSFLCFVAARIVGGRGTLNQTMGALALSTAPRILLVVQALPFATVGGLLLHVWGVLIAYRGVQAAHDLPSGRAAISVLLPFVFLFFLVIGSGFILWTFVNFVGGAP